MKPSWNGDSSLATEPQTKDPRVKNLVWNNFEVKYVWLGMFGGPEGIFQKGWTLEVQGHLWLAGIRCGMLVKVRGGGDDQKSLTGNYRPWGVNIDEYLTLYHDDLDRRNRQYYHEVLEICKLNGTALNFDETSWDLYVWMISKEIIDSSALLPSATKRLARSAVLTGDTFTTPLLVSSCAGAGALSAAAYALKPFVWALASPLASCFLAYKQTDYSAGISMTLTPPPPPRTPYTRDHPNWGYDT